VPVGERPRGWGCSTTRPGARHWAVGVRFLLGAGSRRRLGRSGVAVVGCPDPPVTLTSVLDELPYLRCPLHTILKLTPVAYGKYRLFFVPPLECILKHSAGEWEGLGGTVGEAVFGCRGVLWALFSERRSWISPVEADACLCLQSWIWLWGAVSEEWLCCVELQHT